MTASTEKIRVALCDDHDLFRRGVAEMLSFAEHVEVVGEAKEEKVGGYQDLVDEYNEAIRETAEEQDHP
jgi:DNA-binding NarL/FixJ family response regulator